MPDLKMFWDNPDDANTARMVDRIFDCRWEQYLNAVAHIFNTGQGVVLERSPYSDFVFANALKAKGFISTPCELCLPTFFAISAANPLI